jgi:hypothetical protein
VKTCAMFVHLTDIKITTICELWWFFGFFKIYIYISLRFFSSFIRILSHWQLHHSLFAQFLFFFFFFNHYYHYWWRLIRFYITLERRIEIWVALISLQSYSVILITWVYIDAMFFLFYIFFSSVTVQHSIIVWLQNEGRKLSIGKNNNNSLLFFQVFSIYKTHIVSMYTLLGKQEKKISIYLYEKDNHSSYFKINKITPEHKWTMTTMMMMNGWTDES